MKITTTFWSEQVLEFDTLLYINGKDKEVMFKADLKDKYATYLFFKDVANFMKTKTILNTLNNSYWDKQEYYQFATIYEGEITPIKWFDLVINDKLIVSHDIAFETTLIKRNGVRIPFGRFPMWYYYNKPAVKLPKHREFKIKAKAYNFMANQIKKSKKSF